MNIIKRFALRQFPRKQFFPCLRRLHIKKNQLTKFSNQVCLQSGDFLDQVVYTASGFESKF